MVTDKKKLGEKEPLCAYQKALGFLSRREHSSLELRTKLRKKCYSAAEIAEVIAQLTEQGYLSDKRYAEMLVRSRQSRYGLRHIAAELAAKGIAREKITETLVSLDQDEFSVAFSVWQKRYRQAPTTPQEKARQMAFLQRRGFSVDIILKVLSSNYDAKC